MSRADLAPLVGKTITAVEVTPDGYYLRFTDALGERYTFDAYGECCSRTWIESIDGVDGLLGETVVSAADRFDGSEEKDYDFIKSYSAVLTTRNGHVDIVYRNSSNGYYGGSLDLTAYRPEAPFVPVTESWQAS